MSILPQYSYVSDYGIVEFAGCGFGLRTGDNIRTGFLNQTDDIIDFNNIDTIADSLPIEYHNYTCSIL